MQPIKPGPDGYPKYVYPDPAVLGNIAPKIVNSAKEQVALGKGWYNEYRHQDHPRTMYHENGAKRVVKSPKEEEKLMKEGHWSRIPPEDYVENVAKTADEIAAENAGLREQLAAMENDELRKKLAAMQAKQPGLNLAQTT